MEGYPSMPEGAAIRTQSISTNTNNNNIYDYNLLSDHIYVLISVLLIT